MKNIAIIPARGGSKRLPGKNIRDLNGIPLLAHSILYAKTHSEIIDEIYVSTDDAQIKAIALQYGAKVIDRPGALSGDLDTTVSAMKHVLQTLDDDTIENVILLQPTNPLRPENLLKEAFSIYKAQEKDSLFTVTQSFHKLGKIQEGRFLPFNYTPGQRSQDLEPLFFENGLLYISRAELVFRDLIISENAYPLVMGHPFAGVDIDTAEDFDHAQYIIQKYNNT